MASLRRPEVIVLLLVALGVALWAVLGAGKGTGSDSHHPGARAGEASGTAGLALRSIALTRDYQNARLALDLQLHNPSSQPQLLAPPFLRLLDAQGGQIPPFFLAFNQPPTLPPGTSATHELAFWLEEDHLADEIWLHAGDERTLVKDTTPFDLTSIENQDSRSFKGPRWDRSP